MFDIPINVNPTKARGEAPHSLGLQDGVGGGEDPPVPPGCVVQLQLGLDDVGRLGDEAGQHPGHHPGHEVDRAGLVLLHLPGCEGLQVFVEHEVETREGNVPGQCGHQTQAEAPQSLGRQDGPQCRHHRPVVELAGLEPGLNHCEGDHDGARQGAGGAADHDGLEVGRPALVQLALHVVHRGEVEADPGDGLTEGRDQPPPQSGQALLGHHPPHHPHHGQSPPGLRLLLQPRLDEVQRLEQEGGAGPTEGPGQEGLHHWVGCV